MKSFFSSTIFFTGNMCFGISLREHMLARTNLYHACIPWWFQLGIGWCLAPPRLHVHLVVYFSSPCSSYADIIAGCILLCSIDMIWEYRHSILLSCWFHLNSIWMLPPSHTLGSILGYYTQSWNWESGTWNPIQQNIWHYYPPMNWAFVDLGKISYCKAHTLDSDSSVLLARNRLERAGFLQVFYSTIT